MLGNNVLFIIYYCLVVCCIAISLFLSYYGYLSSFGTLALPFTVIIGLGLFGADILIQKACVAGRRLLPSFGLFLFFSIFSVVSNFNFLYTNFMEENVLKQALDSQYKTFRDNLTATQSALLALDAYTFTEARRVELDRELARLRTQINDPLNPGCGERCREHLDRIEQILGKPLTQLRIPERNSSSRVVNAWYERVREAALNDFQKLLETNSFPQLAALLSDIDAQLLEYDTPDRALARNLGLPILRKLAETSDEIERRANSFFPPDRQIEQEKIDVTLGRLGEIVYSLENGFVEHPNIGATVMSAVLSFVVDFFPVLFAMVAFSPETGGLTKTSPAKRRAGTGTILD